RHSGQSSCWTPACPLYLRALTRDLLVEICYERSQGQKNDQLVTQGHALSSTNLIRTRHSPFPSRLKLLQQEFRTDKKKSVLIEMIARQRDGSPGWFWSVLSLNAKNRVDTQGLPESQTHRPSWWEIA
ncbi:mCG146078, partial [Mus musculus]